MGGAACNSIEIPDHSGQDQGSHWHV